jgi:SAM-dependent methyltransferase
VSAAALYRDDGIRDVLLNFLGPTPLATLEVGCGTGRWLAAMGGRASMLAGVDPSAPLLAGARLAAPAAFLVRARAEDLPWRDAAFDRILCVNALHHFSNRERFFAAALRMLKPGGGLLTLGLDPHAARDQWWVYDFFPETHAIDLARFAPVRLIRGELAKAGFDWAESFEADRVETQIALRDAFPNGVERGFTSQLTALTDDAFARGVERLRDKGEDVWLTADLRWYATVGWLR